MLTSPTPAIHRPPHQDWGVAGLVALLCLALAATALSHANQSSHGVWASVVLFGAAGVLGWKARPRRPQAKRVARALRELSSHGPLAIQLTSHAAEGIGRAGVVYAAIARAEAGEVVLAVAATPAPVLAVARHWQAELGAPLLPGWGLTKSDVESLDGKRPVPVARICYSGPSQHGAGGGAVSLVSSALAILLLAGSVAIFRAHPSSGTSLVLLAVGVSLLLLLAAAMRTDLTCIVVQDSFEVERRCLGFDLGSLRLPLDAVRLFTVVSPDGKHGRHLLLATSEGFWAIECPAALDRVVQGPVVAIRSSLPPLSPQREERTPRIVGGRGLH